MTNINEPCMLVSVSSLIELIDAYQHITNVMDNGYNGSVYPTREAFEADYNKFDFEYKRATKKLRKWNKQTLSN